MSDVVWMTVTFLYGLLVIVTAIFRPRWLGFLPGIRWFGGGPVAGRFTMILCGIAVFVAGFWQAGVLRGDVLSTLAIVLGFLILCGGMYDFATAAERTFGDGSNRQDD